MSAVRDRSILSVAQRWGGGPFAEAAGEGGWWRGPSVTASPRHLPTLPEQVPGRREECK